MAFVQQDLFRDTYASSSHGSYSHGLEKIYAIETIDIKSVRKIPPKADSPAVSLKIKRCKKTAEKSFAYQLELPLLHEYSFHKDYFLYKEPIQVLMLPQKLEKDLLAQDKFCLKDLLDEEGKLTDTLDKIGQGHLDELENKLRDYIQQNSLSDASPKIDYCSWLKIVLGDLSPLKCALLLEEFHIPPFLPMLQSTRMEMRKLSPENKALLLAEAISEAQSKEKCLQFQKDLKAITETYLKPWLHKRAGIASLDELKDHLRKLSGFNDNQDNILALLEKLYCEDCFLFSSALTPIERNIFCADLSTAEAFHDVVGKTYSYFYKDTLHYSLTALIKWIIREFAKVWQSFPPGFLERVLRLSSEFRVRKDDSEELIVRLS